MFKNIRTKFYIFILPFVILTLFLSCFISLRVAKEVIRNQIDARIESNKDEFSVRIKASIMLIQRSTDEMATFVGTTYENVSMDDYTKILENSVKTRPNMLGMGIWFEPYAYDTNDKYKSVYVKRSGQEFVVEQEFQSQKYDYFSQDYIKAGKEAGRNVFTAKYYDPILKEYIITNNSPIYNSNGEYIGCVTCDFSTSKIQKFLKQHAGEEINLSIVDGKGFYIGDSSTSEITSYQNILNTENEEYTDIANTILSTQTDVLSYNKDGEEYIVYFDTINDLNWKIIYELPQSIVDNPVNKIMLVFYMITILILLIIIFAIRLVTNSVVHKPLELLLLEFESISNNTFTLDVPERLLNSKDEFGIIGKALEEMKENIKQYKTDVEDQYELLLERDKTFKESAEYNKAIINALPLLILVLTKDGFCLDCNGNAMFDELPTDYYINENLSKLIPKESSDKILEEMSCLKSMNDVREFEICHNVLDNKEYFIAKITMCSPNQFLLIISRTTDLHEKIKEIEYLSYHDQITGLNNRIKYEQVLKEIVSRDQLPISVIVSDINGLKLINDSFGHDAGDELLVKFSNILKEVNVGNDYIYRTGGDEFALILKETNEEKAKKIIDKLMLKCSKEDINGLSLSASFGVGTIINENDSITKVLKIAEDSMYQQKLYESSSRKDNTVDIINNTLQAKNPREQLHSNRVAEFCEKTAIALGMSISDQNKLRTAGLLHDIGKIGIPEELLNKPGRLTEEEYKEICKHPEIGYRILESSGNMKEISDCVLSHHERWDGGGYPRGIKGEEISIEARIIAIADTFDAMTSERSYRKGLPKEVAIEELIRCKGTQFDPELVDVFIDEVLGM